MLAFAVLSERQILLALERAGLVKANGGGPQQRSALDRRIGKVTERTRSINELLGQLKHLLLLPFVVGPLILFGYLTRVGAPLPSLDFGILLPALTVVFLFVFSISVVYFGLPSFTLLLFGKDYRQAFPSLYRDERSFSRAGFSLAVQRYFCQQSLAVVLVLAILSAEFFPRKAEYVFYGSFVLSILISAAYLVYWQKRKDRVSGGSLFNAVTLGSLMSIIWFFIVYNVVHILLSQAGMRSAWLITLLIVGLFVLHFFLVGFGASVRNTLPFVLAISFVLLYWWPGFPGMSGAVLRQLGIGGGLPVTLLVRTMDEGKNEQIARKLSGCFILGVGNEVLFHRALSPTECETRWNGKEEKAAVARLVSYEGLQRFARSDIIEWSEFKDLRKK